MKTTIARDGKHELWVSFFVFFLFDEESNSMIEWKTKRKCTKLPTISEMWNNFSIKNYTHTHEQQSTASRKMKWEEKVSEKERQQMKNGKKNYKASKRSEKTYKWNEMRPNDIQKTIHEQIWLGIKYMYTIQCVYGVHCGAHTLTYACMCRWISNSHIRAHTHRSYAAFNNNNNKNTEQQASK